MLHASTGRTLRLLVVDDHPVVCDGVRSLVRYAPDLDVVGSARTAREGIELAGSLRPDIVLLDLRLPDMLGSEALPRVLAVSPATRVVIFTAFEDHAALDVAMAAGAHGCLLKDVTHTDLVEQLRRIAAGVRVVDPRLRESGGALLQARLFQLSLSRREYEVVRLAATGKTNPEIAEDLGLARNTVKTYLQSAMQKLGARNRVEAVRRAREEYLL
ncbi:response regulator transcription factor [Streptomyces sp. NBC_00841]|uniref:response regulator n=1 Tax=unclassified Streptomyces TaxID=2593676 RepID=UPI002254EFEE|nr:MULTISPECIES: response regulator transcription factor [unclassified Streptomyces]MCX4530865.1 response regulator transcription factor [Streptomyces sp. NBC_01669]WSA03386.1 response regulator transcription factor [Streptomyces sp. NBC_00841]